MKRSELIRSVAQKTGLSEKKTHQVLRALIDAIHETLAQGETITIDGLGKFYLSHYRERILRSPHGEICHIYTKKIPRFKVSGKLKMSLKDRQSSS